MFRSISFSLASLTTHNLPLPEAYANFRNGEGSSDLHFSLRPMAGGGLPPSATPRTFQRNGIRVERREGGFSISSGKAEDGSLARIDARECYTRLEAEVGENASEAFAHCLRVALESGLVRRGRITLHAAAVELEGRALLLTGHSGVGKSTRADLMIEHFGATRISGDRPCLDVETKRVYGMPWDGKEKCYRDCSFPALAILEVRRGKGDFLLRLSPAQARRVMLARGFIPIWDEETAAIALAVAEKAAREIPCYRLYCSPDKAGVSAIVDALWHGDARKIKGVEADMKIKNGFALRKIIDETMAMPIGENVEKFQATIVLNEVSAFIWRQLQEPKTVSDLVALVTAEYRVDAETAENDIRALLEKLRGMDVLEE